MSYDGIVTRSVVTELNRTIVGGKIDKVYQPEKDELILVVRTPAGSYRLLLSASASHARVHLTQVSRENPMVPPMLCMLMRKHLQGGKITAVTQQGFDRVLRIDVESYNELGDLTCKSIVAEIMGRHSNVVLIDGDGKIMDSAKHVDFTVSAVRQILPGLIYQEPPSQDKQSPDHFSLVDVLGALDHSPEDTQLDKFLLNTFMGLSPLLAREIVYRFGGNVKLLKKEVDTAAFVAHATGFFKEICTNAYTPTLVTNPQEKRPTAFSCVSLTQYQSTARLESFESISQVIDSYYEKRAQREHMNQRCSALTKLVHNNIDRCNKKLVLHRENLEKSKNRETYKIYGDLVTANLYRLESGMKELEAENYYSETLAPIRIPLKEDLSPSQNAQRYYKLYTKAKGTEKYAVEQIQEAETEKVYLESVLESLETAETPGELAEIREELADGGYVPKPLGKSKKSGHKFQPLKFTSSDGFEILVGRNNRQNDELTIRTAYSTDIWLHTKNIPGSHTIIRTQGGKEIPKQTLLEAAQLSAYYSKARNSSQVPVDYTPVKNVKKPNGAKPGMVIYDHYNTLYVLPQCPKEQE